MDSCLSPHCFLNLCFRQHHRSAASRLLFCHLFIFRLFFSIHVCSVLFSFRTLIGSFSFLFVVLYKYYSFNIYFKFSLLVFHQNSTSPQSVFPGPGAEGTFFLGGEWCRSAPWLFPLSDISNIHVFSKPSSKEIRSQESSSALPGLLGTNENHTNCSHTQLVLPARAQGSALPRFFDPLWLTLWNCFSPLKLKATKEGSAALCPSTSPHLCLWACQGVNVWASVCMSTTLKISECIFGSCQSARYFLSLSKCV